MRNPIQLKILFFVIIVFCTGKTKGQNGLDITYDFCTDSLVTSTIYSCFADTNQYYTMGATLTLGVSPMHGTLASFDYKSNLLWYKKLFFNDRNASTTTKGIIKINANKYVANGFIFNTKINPTYTLWQPYLYIFNSLGDSIRCVTYADSINSYNFNSVLYDNGFLVTAGLKAYPSPAAGALWLCKYDTAGTLIWEKEYLKSGATNVNDANAIQSADKKNYVIAGDIYDTSSYKLTSCILKIDSSGNLIWVKSLKRPFFSPQNRVDVVANPSGGYYFVSYFLKLSPDSPKASHIYYGKLDENGDTIWTRTFQKEFYNSYGLQIAWTPDKQNLVLLVAPSSGASSGAMKIDTLGNVVWYHRYGHYVNGENFGGILQSLSVTPDNRYLMAGQCVNETQNGNYSWMVLTDKDGIRYPGDPAGWPLSVRDNSASANSIAIYPNPVKNELTIEGIQTPTTLYVYDMVGRLVYGNSITGKTIINTQTWVQGNYILQLQNESGRMVKKVVKE